MTASRPALHLRHVRLHVRQQAADREAALIYRLRLSRLLGAAELLPAGIPPSAVLAVRRLEDPLPGRLPLNRRGFAPPAAWEGAVRRAIEESCRRAARPQRGRLPTAAQAVLFADEAELLACLALALLQGRSSREWWWESLLPALGLAGAASAAPGWDRSSPAVALLCQPARLPAVLGCLAEWGQALPVVSALAPAEARRALDTMLAAHSLPPLAAAGGLAPPFAPPETGAQAAIPPEHPERLPASAAQRGLLPQPAAPPPASPPWEPRLLPEGLAGWLGRERAALLGIGLSLARRPGAAFQPSFWTTLRRWWEGASQGRHALRPSRRPASPQTAPEMHPAPPTDLPASAPPGAAPVSETSASGYARLPARLDAPAGADGSAFGSPAAPAEAGQLAAQLFNWSAGVETSLGGVLFLLNLMRHLDIPAVFEPGWGLESQVGAWGSLELLARALLAEAGAQHAFDPLWRLLAELDDRPQETLPGEGFTPSGPGGLPPGWEPAAPEAGLDAVPLLEDLNPDLLGWLSFALPPMRQRLLAALGLAETEAERLPALLLVLPGRLHCTRSHLDLVLRLEDARIPVRQAGLDANPGWLPRLGRIVTFHYQ